MVSLEVVQYDACKTLPLFNLKNPSKPEDLQVHNGTKQAKSNGS